MRTAHSLTLACALAAGLPSASLGLGIRIADQDARATARGNAFSATADNPSAIYYNPAGITWLYAPDLNSPSLSLSGSGKGSIPAQTPGSTGSAGGLLTRLGLYSITLGNEVNLSGGRGSLDISDRWQMAGNFYATWKAGNSPVTFGLGVYSP
jgi:long-chain fatty acid transport protein